MTSSVSLALIGVVVTATGAGVAGERTYDPSSSLQSNLATSEAADRGGPSSDTLPSAPPASVSTGLADTPWVQVDTATSPAPGGVIADDAASGYLVYFGSDGSTWTFQQSTWSQIHPALSPPALGSVGMTYDWRDGYVLLLDGNQTWTFSAGSWVQLHPSTFPSYRTQIALAYDPAASAVILYGGWPGGSYGTQPLNDTWEFAGGVWTKIATPASPGPRDDYGLAYYPPSQEVILWGGNDVSDVAGTWEFSQGNWSEISTPSAPPSRSGPILAWDSTASFLVMFGGCTSSPGNCNTYFGDTWAFTGMAWTQLDPPTSPPAQLGMAATNQSEMNGGVVLFSTDGTTWTYDVPTYPIAFSELGLLSGASWSVTLGRDTESASDPIIDFFNQEDGTYSFSVNGPLGETPDPSTGTVSVSGRSSTNPVTFASNATTVVADHFASDIVLNGSLWEVDSPILASIAGAESHAWETAESVGSVVPPLNFGGAGLEWSADGVGNWTGLTSTVAVAPPAATEVELSLGAFTGGNPAFACLSDLEAQFVCVFLSDQLWYVNGVSSPTDMGGYLAAGVPYSVWLNSTTEGISIAVSGSGVSAWDVSFDPPDEAYYLTIGSLAGQLPGEAGTSASDTAYFSEASIMSEQTWGLSASVTGSAGQPLGGASVAVLDTASGSILGSGQTPTSGVVVFEGLPASNYLVEAYYPSGTLPGGPPVAPSFASVDVGAPTSPERYLAYANLTIETPSITPVSVSIGDSPEVGLVSAGQTLQFFAEATGGTQSYNYLWTASGRLPCSSTSSVLECTFLSAGAFQITVSVTCSGAYFDQNCPSGMPGSPSDPATALEDIEVVGGTYDAPVSVSSDWVLGPPMSFSFPGTGQTDHVELGLPNSATGIDTVTADVALPAPWQGSLLLPTGIAGLLDYSPAFYEAEVAPIAPGGSVGPFYPTGLTLQAGLSSFADATFSLPPGSPTVPTELAGQTFELDFSATSCFALAEDSVAVFFSTVLSIQAQSDLGIGPGTELFLAAAETVTQSLASDLATLGCTSDSIAPTGTWAGDLADMWNDMPGLIIGLAGSLGETAVVNALTQAVGSVVDRALTLPGYVVGMTTMGSAVLLYPEVAELLTFGAPISPLQTAGSHSSLGVLGDTKPIALGAGLMAAVGVTTVVIRRIRRRGGGTTRGVEGSPSSPSP